MPFKVSITRIVKNRTFKCTEHLNLNIRTFKCTKKCTVFGTKIASTRCAYICREMCDIFKQTNCFEYKMYYYPVKLSSVMEIKMML